MKDMVQEAMEIKRQKMKNGSDSDDEDDEDEIESGTILKVDGGAGQDSTMKYKAQFNTGTFKLEALLC